MNFFKKNWISRLFASNLAIKILSIVIAVIGWLLIAMIVSPDAEMTVRNVPVRIALEDSTAQRLGLDVIEGDDQTVNINVRGKRYELGSLSIEDFDVRALPASVAAPGEFSLRVIAQKTDPSREFEIISTSVEEITARFDRMGNRVFPLTASVDKITFAEGFIKNNPVATVTPNEVTITGPETYLSKIGRCVVRTDLEMQISETLVTPGTLEIYGLDGQLMDPDENQFALSTRDFSISVPVLQQKVLPLTFDYLNIPNGFDLSTLPYTLSSDKITVAAPVDVIRSTDSLKIGYVDFKQLDLGYSKVFEVVLPTGFIDSTNLSRVTARFDTSGFTSKYLRINSDNLRLRNIPEGYTARVITQYIDSVKVIGSEENLSVLASSDLVGEIDLMNATITEDGRYTVPVSVTFPAKNGVWAVGEYTAVVDAERVTE